MNKEWVNTYREMSIFLKHKSTFDDGMAKLFHLRRIIYSSVLEILENDRAYLSEIVYRESVGYESKTVIYSLFHIFRIEDIVCNILMQNKDDIFTTGDYQNKLKSSISTTDCDLTKDEIVEFSKNVDLKYFLKYMEDVYTSSNNYLMTITYEDLKKKISPSNKEKLESMHKFFDENESVINKILKDDYLDILKKVFSEHWLLHAHAANRIINRINAIRKVSSKLDKLESNKEEKI